MFLNESLWVKKRLESLPYNIRSVLNVGSSTLYYRTKEFPYIDQNVFEPLKQRGIQVFHTDIIKSEGVDLIGDLTENCFAEDLKQRKFDVVLCNNLLEHIVEKELICNVISEIIPSGGFCLVTVPFRYPYHYDPIDTMFRPGIEDLAKLFRGFDLISGEIISDNRTYWDMLKKDKRLAWIIFRRLFLPFYKPRMWWNTFSYLPHSFKRFKTTGILLRKNN